jgi:maleylpyruvate isomerase
MSLLNPVAAALDATSRYLSTVATLSDEQLREPSLLPGWSRGHVVAHVALNAQGIARALRGLRTGEPVARYDSPEARDADIEARAGQGAEELAGLSQLACLRLAGELRLMPALGQVDTFPGGPSVSIADLVDARWREVEVHHADLGLDYGPADWPLPFAARLLHELAEDRGEQGVALTLHARDLGETLLVGPGGHGVAGSAADLAWWLSGRGDGTALAVTRPLPDLAPWR